MLSACRACHIVQDRQTEMWCLILLFVAIAGCHAREQYHITPVALPATSASRIVGGSATTIQQYPFAVQIYYNNGFSCGGTLLTQRHVLSAAHCFVTTNGVVISPSTITIRVGSTFLYSGGATHQVSAIIVHESYGNPIRDNDIAVLLLRTAVTLNASVATAFIPIQGAVVPDNATVIAVGWGVTIQNGQNPSPVLNEVAIRKINRGICQANYLELQALEGIPYPVTSSMICAGILGVGGKDACQGDSGGPLIYNGIVVGVTSWGYGCAQPRYPGVSARVASYTTWINNTVTRYNGASSVGVARVTLLIPFLYLILSRSY
uniref:Trypsin-like serine protease n=1 Tax=Spodoptera frugiperda TaxID=7108 RepID=A0A089QFN5_SPOFR|nr:trypsin-like serine protease precursor [Spodoptera frugiperda]